MAKAGGAIPAWFWPAGVPRRVPVPQQTLARSLQRVLSAKKGAPAVITTAGAVTYGELYAGATRLAAALQARPGGAVLVAEPDPARALTGLLASWLSGKAACLADPASDTPAREQAVRQSGATLVLGEAEEGRWPGAEAITFDAAVSTPLRPLTQRFTDKALYVPGAYGMVAHSHFSLAGMGIAFATFVAELKELPFWAVAPLWRWETLVPVMAALLNGTPMVFAGADERRPGAEGPTAGGYTIIDEPSAERMVASGSAAPFLDSLRYAFVSKGAFSARWRRALERVLGRQALMAWGMAEAGPVIAAHPSWVPLQSHGFPMVNVTLFPVDAARGQLSIVPWGMLDRAELGVESISAMLGYADESANDRARIGKILRSGVSASMDNVGVVTLLP